MRNSLSNMGTFYIILVSIIIASSIAVVAGQQLGLSLAETLLSVLVLSLLTLNIHVLFALSRKDSEDLDEDADQKLNFIANELVQMRQQQANLRKHIDHELKFMHGVHQKSIDQIKQIDEKLDDQSDQLISNRQLSPEFYENDNVAAARITQDAPKQLDHDTGLYETHHDRDDKLIELLTNSLADNKVDLYAQPIVKLPSRRIAYYESYTWIRDENGKIITPREYLETAERAGVMPVIDNLMLFRSVLLARRFVERNRDLKIFCNISGHSLLDVTFFDQFIDFMKNNAEQSRMLIFEFSQRTLDETGIVEYEGLHTLAEMGFKFSLDNVLDLNVDLKKLYSLGFRYIKINANIFLNNAEEHGAQILVDDFAEHVKRSGLELIIDGVQNEHIVPELLDLNVEYSQGYLFGEPTLVRDKAQLGDELPKSA